MVSQKLLIPLIFIFLAITAGCELIGERMFLSSPPGTASNSPSSATELAIDAPTRTLPPPLTQAPSPSPTITPIPTATEVVFDVGEELTIAYLRELDITGSPIIFETRLSSGPNYERHLVSYVSEGSTIYGMLTIPFAEPPQDGYKAIVFNHGYIPPAAYRTTERYLAYVDNLARSGFVVFKIDFRGHGQSEGEATGSYFSPGYTIDSIAALKSLQTLEFIDPQGIGMWGHSMAGNLLLRAMLIEPDIKAGVIWAGAVYSYDDFVTYGIDDNTFRPPPTQEGNDRPRRSQELFDRYGRPDTSVDYWRAVSLTANIGYLISPLQIHHASDDTVVSINYSEGLAAVLWGAGKKYEFYIYEGGGHDLNSPYFGQAMQRTVAFFRENL